jgi:manganese/iron transport system permease protein
MIRFSALWSSGIMRRATLEAVLAGGFAGVVGVHVVLRRLSFFTMAMAHATFPGIVLAYWVGLLPLAGALGFGWLLVLPVLALGRLRALDHSSVVGVVLAGSLGLGVMLQGLQPRPTKDLAALLAGQILAVDRTDLITQAVVAVVVGGFLVAVHKELVLGAFDRSGATALGYGGGLDAALLMALVAAVVTTVPAVGTILSVALVVVPALAARLWTDRLGLTFVLAGLIGAASGVVGLAVSATWDIAAGGAIALTVSAGFAISWLAGAHGLRGALGR